MVTLEELQDLVYYDPSDRTFCLVWKPRLIDNSGFNTRLAGTKAGCMTAQGYVHVYINGAARKLHRLVYMLHNNIKKLSDVPTSIDHIDRDNTNNLIENLRDGSVICYTGVNSRNRDGLGVSKYRGVSLSDKLRNKYNASISINLQETTIVYYKTEKYCAEVYKAACKYLGYDIDDIFNSVEDIPLSEDVINRIQSAKNKKIKEKGTSIFSGVTWSRERQKYVARVHTYECNKSKNYNVGYYTDEYEAAIRRDLFIIDKCLHNTPQFIDRQSKEEYLYFRDQFPKDTIKLLKVTHINGDVEFFTGMTKASDTLHICKKNLSAYLNGRSYNKYADRFDFSWFYEEKK